MPVEALVRGQRSARLDRVLGIHVGGFRWDALALAAHAVKRLWEKRTIHHDRIVAQRLAMSCPRVIAHVTAQQQCFQHALRNFATLAQANCVVCNLIHTSGADELVGGRIF